MDKLRKIVLRETKFWKIVPNVQSWITQKRLQIAEENVATCLKTGEKNSGVILGYI